ncbi:hypothetical protein [Asticcacaulis benevestitus]|uniref:Uncharacterized protein n=1 Tax=Asticcacaulis benevestitus DSM 16100 = ATCC BAA-896 TaxID=1121022 RepID=V4PZJ1_9CAUL|nr:hypothetical protein [Asticcacaulis benevestitus]ESQ92849.1 hypothetical protein ABENE_07030 [Asticcacaulis benevestitus DSM 16100 = ATCC BAA-896]
MSGLFVAFAVLSGLSPRPVSLTGPLGQPAYEAAVNSELALDGIDVRIERYFGVCKVMSLESEGFEAVTDDRTAYLPTLDQIPTQSSEARIASAPRFPELITLATAAAPDGSAAIEHIRVAGCGKTYRLNLMSKYVAPALMPKVNMMEAGHSLTTPGIQARTEADVVNQVQEDRRNRPDIKCGMVPLVYDIRVVSPPDSTGQWREQWDTYYCQASQTTEVIFTPSADGKALAIDGKLISSR